jgi:hypothetical protein
MQYTKYLIKLYCTNAMSINHNNELQYVMQRQHVFLNLKHSMGKTNFARKKILNKLEIEHTYSPT